MAATDHLSTPQTGRYQYWRRTTPSGRINISEYTISKGDTHVGAVYVNEIPSGEKFDVPLAHRAGGVRMMDDLEQRGVEEAQGWSRAASERWHEAHHGEPPLFESWGQGPVHKVDDMYGTRSGVGAMMNVAGMIANRARSQGATVGTPWNLSEHSARLVQGLQRRGLVPESAANEVVNDITFSREGQPFLGRPPELEIPRWEVSAGRQAVRNLARHRPTEEGPTPPPKPLRGQQRLF